MDKRTGYIVEELFRLGALSNQELSKHMELSPASITHLLQPLVTHGILEERPPEDYPEDILQDAQGAGQRRRRKITVYPNKKLGYVLCGEFNNSGVIFRKVRFDLVAETAFENSVTFAPGCDVLQTLTSSIRDILAQETHKLLAIGFTVSGLIDPSGTRVLQSTHQPFLADLEIPAVLGKTFEVPVVLSNDANTLSQYERFVGKAKEVRHFLTLYINEGVGLGIFTNGKPYAGHLNQAGEAGHWIVDPLGVQLPGIPRGSFEAYVSQQALCKQMTDAGYMVSTETAFSTLIAELAAEKPSPKAKEILESLCEKTALLCSNLLNVFAPERIYLYGPLSMAGETYLEPIRKHISQFTAGLKKPRVAEGVELSDHWQDALCLGTAKCAIDAYLEKTVQDNLGKNKLKRKKPVRLKPLFNTPPRKFSPPGSP